MFRGATSRRVRAQRIVGGLLVVAALAAALVAFAFLTAASEAWFFAQAVLMSIGIFALLAAAAFGIVAYFSFRGGLPAQVGALVVSSVVLSRIGPYFARILRRGDDITWLAPVGAAVVAFAFVFAASAYGLLRRARRRA